MHRNTFVLLVFAASIIIITVCGIREGFGYSMGTLVQLQTSHVPSSPQELEQEQEDYVRQVNHDLVAMTGSGL
jgi:preprotein translocase subunit SecF